MSDEELDDEEVVELRKLKSMLLKNTIELRKELVAFEKANGKDTAWTEKDFLPIRSEFHDLLTDHNANVNYVSKKYVAVSSFMMGIKFNAVDKKWISGHKYLYSANVKSKALAFDLEITLDTKDADKSLEILGIVCHFVNVRKCYSLEITPWVHRFSEAKDTCNLFRAIADYTEHNVTRTKILRKFQEYNVASVEECTEDDGGIMISLHAKNDSEFVYFEIRWVLRFVESLWRIDNSFVIEPISAGDDFLEANRQLLQSFCKYRIKKDDLEELWEKLCSAVEKDETSQLSTTGTTTS